jgi:hypothetical protein
MNKLMMGLLVVLISGCAGQQLYKEGATDQVAYKDNMECDLIAMQYATGMGFNGNYLIINDYKMKCLRSRGWN